MSNKQYWQIRSVSYVMDMRRLAQTSQWIRLLPLVTLSLAQQGRDKSKQNAAGQIHKRKATVRCSSIPFHSYPLFTRTQAKAHLFPTLLSYCCNNKLQIYIYIYIYI
eukprot:gene7052-4995_t